MKQIKADLFQEPMETLMPEEVTSMIDFVYFGRNDNYHADYLERTNACLNYNLRSIHQAGLIGKVRLLFVDWASEQPLTEKLAIKDIYFDSIQFLYLDSSFLGKYDFDIGKINPPFACNVGLYYSKAGYLFWAASDLIATSRDFQHLYRATQELRGHEDTKLWMAERAFLSRDFFTKPRSFEDVDYYLRNFYFEPEPISGAGGGAALIGAKRTRLIEWGGLNEACSGCGGNDTELFIRATKYESFVNLSKRYGVYFHKFPYSNRGMRSKQITQYDDSWRMELDSRARNQIPFKPGELNFQTPTCSSRDSNFPNLPKRSPSIRNYISGFGRLYTSLLANNSYRFKSLILDFSEAFKLKDLEDELNLYNVDVIVLKGNFRITFPISLNLINRAASIIWIYPQNINAITTVITFLAYSRSFLPWLHNTVCGSIFPILDKHILHLNNETLDFLKGKQVIVFSKVDNQIYSNILDGAFLESLKDEWPFPNEDSKKLKSVREPLLLFVFFVVMLKSLLQRALFKVY